MSTDNEPAMPLTPSNAPLDLSTALDKLDGAQQQMETMSTAMGRLQTTVAELSRKLYQSRLVGTIVIVGFVLDLLLTGWVTYLTFSQQTVAQHQQQQANVIQQVQERTSQQVLCPLFRLLIGFQRESARAAYPLGPAAYDTALAQMRQSFQALNCR